MTAHIASNLDKCRSALMVPSQMCMLRLACALMTHPHTNMDGSFEV